MRSLFAYTRHRKGVPLARLTYYMFKLTKAIPKMQPIAITIAIKKYSEARK